jgi:hypothetical protein
VKIELRLGKERERFWRRRKFGREFIVVGQGGEGEGEGQDSHSIHLG